MKKNLHFLNLIASIVCILFFSSCKVYFNQSTRDRIETHGIDKLQSVQFYNDKEIILQYRTVSSKEKISGGKLRFENGYYIYTVIIPKNTPAVAKYLDGKRLEVYFESGNDRYLVFGKSNNNSSNSTYQLYGTPRDNKFYVFFEGVEMKVIEGTYTHLKIKKNVSTDIEIEERKVKGFRVKKE